MKDLIESLARKAGDTLMNYFRQDWALLKKRGTAKEVVTSHDKEVGRLAIFRAIPGGPKQATSYSPTKSSTRGYWA